MTDARTEEPPTGAAPAGDGPAPATQPPGGAGRDGGGPAHRLIAPVVARAERLGERPTDELVAMVVTATVVAVCVIVVVMVLGLPNLFSDTTPAGGDMGAHVWGPAYLRDHLLAKGRLSGWTMDWYDGFPAYQFYMIPPSLLIAVLSWVIPYGVAFKLVAVSGCVSFPVACWFLGRSARAPFPVPALLALGGLAFLFDRSFSIYGGNLASTMAGEFAFSMSLSLGVLYLGVLVRGFETGRHRAWAAALLALTGLCHLIPLVFVLVCTAVYLLVRPGTGRLWYVAAVAPVAGALTAFWTLPFVARSGYMNDMGWERITSERYVNYLWSRTTLDPQLVNAPDLRWVIALAAVGLLLSLVFRRRLGLFLALVAVAFAIGFIVAPQGRLWNARLLPFYYLALYLLAGVGVAEGGRLLATLVARDIARPVKAVVWSTPAAAMAGMLVMLGMSLAAMPGGEMRADGSYSWGVGPFTRTTTDRSFIDSWADWNFEGYEGTSVNASGEVEYRKSYPEYHDLTVAMAGVGRDRGCGRAMWEHEEAHDRYGTPMALMLLPFWTDGCIGSVEGLYFEASATTPYHFIDQDELSWAPSNAQREMPYGPGPPTRDDFDRGVKHLQMMGVRYYMAINRQTQELANENRSLTRLADSGPWIIYQVADAPLVQGLANQPAVLTDQPTTGRPWQDVSVCWWIDPQAWDVMLTASGPPEWQRVARTRQPDAVATPSQRCLPEGWGWFDGGRGPAARPAEPVAVSNVSVTDDGVSFDVDRTGVPVLVKVSYFPNWSASGASGPFRATPNFMVVVPESNHVELHYGWTGVDLGAILLTLLGLAGAVWLARTRPVGVSPPTAFWGRAERPDLYPPPSPASGDGASPEPPGVGPPVGVGVADAPPVADVEAGAPAPVDAGAEAVEQEEPGDRDGPDHRDGPALVDGAATPEEHAGRDEPDTRDEPGEPEARDEPGAHDEPGEPEARDEPGEPDEPGPPAAPVDPGGPVPGAGAGTAGDPAGAGSVPRPDDGGGSPPPDDAPAT